jgi:hypothetical protein
MVSDLTFGVMDDRKTGNVGSATTAMFGIVMTREQLIDVMAFTYSNLPDDMSLGVWIHADISTQQISILSRHMRVVVVISSSCSFRRRAYNGRVQLGRCNNAVIMMMITKGNYTKTG